MPPVAPPEEASRLTPAEVEAAVEKYMPMMALWAHKARRRNPEMSFEDALQAAVLGFLYGATKFDKTRGLEVSTYVGFWVRTHIAREAHAHASRGMAKRRHGSSIVPVPVARLDAAHPADDSTMAGTLAAPEDPPEAEFSPKFWDKVRAQLSDREFAVVHCRFVRGMTYREAGLELKISRERVRQVEIAALQKLGRRCDFGDDAAGGY